MLRLSSAALALAAAAAAAAPTRVAAHVDAMLLIGPDGRLETGSYDFGDGRLINATQRVYEGEFDDFGSSGDPGFNAIASSSSQLPAGFSALPGNADVGFNGLALAHGGERAGLWHWDATAPVDFDPVDASTRLDLIFGRRSSTLDASASDASGFVFSRTSANGALHEHLSFGLDDGDGDDAVLTAAEGFYLWSMEMIVGSGASALTSDPIFFVHGLGEPGEELHEQAISFVQTQIVPEPATATLLLGVGGLAALRRRASA